MQVRCGRGLRRAWKMKSRPGGVGGRGGWEGARGGREKRGGYVVLSEAMSITKRYFTSLLSMRS